MDWLFNKKTYPQYWIDYENHFDRKRKKQIQSSRFVVLDTETTGFDYEVDRLLCMGAVSIENNEIRVMQVFEVYIKQDHFNPKTVEIHGIIHHTKTKTHTEEDAIIQFLNYIKDSVLVAHHAVFDIKMINTALRRMGLPKLKNQVLDTTDLYNKTKVKSNFINQNKKYTLDDIAEDYSLDLSDRHTAAGDALITALIFLKTTSILNKSKSFKLASIFIKRNRF